MNAADARCPICKKPVAEPPANATYPFCSDRCKLIDLGRWLDGKYLIPLERPVSDTDWGDEEEP